MELNWTRFVLELINFLVLVWLLKRLFYTPVMQTIAARRAAVEKKLADAESAKCEAASLESTYQDRLRDWDEEKQRRREELGRAMEQERERRMKLLEDSMTAEREKAEAREEKRKAEQRVGEEKQAMNQALEFTSRLLHELASPELERKIVDLVLQRISSASAEELPGDSALGTDHDKSVQVSSAYELPQPQRAALSTVISRWLGTEVTANYKIDTTLLAGLEIRAGAYVLRANLRDELEYFAETRNHE